MTRVDHAARATSLSMKRFHRYVAMYLGYPETVLWERFNVATLLVPRQLIRRLNLSN